MTNTSNNKQTFKLRDNKWIRAVTLLAGCWGIFAFITIRTIFDLLLGSCLMVQVLTTIYSIKLDDRGLKIKFGLKQIPPIKFLSSSWIFCACFSFGFMFNPLGNILPPLIWPFSAGGDLIYYLLAGTVLLGSFELGMKMRRWN